MTDWLSIEEQKPEETPRLGNVTASDPVLFWVRGQPTVGVFVNGKPIAPRVGDVTYWAKVTPPKMEVKDA